MLKIMLLCGSGASSGFMAANLRKEAEKRALDCEIFARSDSELEEYLSSVDVIMLGSHYEYMLKDIREKAKPFNVVVDVIKSIDYGLLNGKAVLDHALRIYEEGSSKNE